MTVTGCPEASTVPVRKISQRRLAVGALALSAAGWVLLHPIVALVLTPPSWVLVAVVVGRHWRSPRERRDRVALAIAALAIAWPWIYVSLGIWLTCALTDACTDPAPFMGPPP